MAWVEDVTSPMTTEVSDQENSVRFQVGGDDSDYNQDDNDSNRGEDGCSGNDNHSDRDDSGGCGGDDDAAAVVDERQSDDSDSASEGTEVNEAANEPVMAPVLLDRSRVVRKSARFDAQSWTKMTISKSGAGKHRCYHGFGPYVCIVAKKSAIAQPANQEPSPAVSDNMLVRSHAGWEVESSYPSTVTRDNRLYVPQGKAPVVVREVFLDEDLRQLSLDSGGSSGRPGPSLSGSFGFQPTTGDHRSEHRFNMMRLVSDAPVWRTAHPGAIFGGGPDPLPVSGMVPIVEVRIAGKVAHALIDTGASMSIINISFVRGMGEVMTPTYHGGASRRQSNGAYRWPRQPQLGVGRYVGTGAFRGVFRLW